MNPVLQIKMSSTPYLLAKRKWVPKTDSIVFTLTTKNGIS